jgi:hypothetical protein
MNTPPVITNANDEAFPSYYQFTLHSSVEEIESILGFKGDASDEYDKVENSWRFLVDGKKCAIWDYRRSHYFGRFSAWGDAESLKKLFGSKLSA